MCTVLRLQSFGEVSPGLKSPGTLTVYGGLRKILLSYLLGAAASFLRDIQGRAVTYIYVFLLPWCVTCVEYSYVPFIVLFKSHILALFASLLSFNADPFTTSCVVLIARLYSSLMR